jgi:FMN phosphatase YigB (HAD superfamily)
METEFVAITIHHTRTMLYSFDLFDTLITRRTATPSGIFTVLREILRAQHAADYPVDLVENFYHYRQKAAHHAHIKVGTGVSTIDDIYSSLYDFFSDRVSKDKIFFIRDLEIETELQWCVPIAENIQKVHKLLDKNKRVVLISDMYLPKNVIVAMLKKIDPCLADCPLYLSSDVGATKWQGGLFDYVAEHENVRFEDWYHYGDNEEGDIKIPSQKGIHTSLYTGSILHKIEQSYLRENFFFHQLFAGASRLYRIENPEANDIQILGATLAGPLLYGYVEFILDDAHRRGIKRLFFLSRDGKILMKIAEKINSVREYGFELKYLFCSRGALYRAVDIKFDVEFWASSFQQNGVRTCQEIADWIGVNAYRLFSQLPEYLQTVIGDVTTVLNWQQITDLLQHLFANENFRKEMECHFSDYHSIVMDYFRQEGVFDDPTVVVVDSAGAGRMRDVLYQVLKAASFDAKLLAYYFAAYDTSALTSERNQCIPYMGWWIWGYSHSKTAFLLEALMNGDHGTVVGYKRDNKNDISPMTGNCDHLIHWGICKQHVAILDFVQNYLDSSLSFPNSGLPAKAIVEQLLRLLSSPDVNIAETYGTFPIVLGGDTNERSILRLAPPITWENIWSNAPHHTFWKEASFVQSSIFMRSTYWIKQNVFRFIRLKKIIKHPVERIVKFSFRLKKIIEHSIKRTIKFSFCFLEKRLEKFTGTHCSSATRETNEFTLSPPSSTASEKKQQKDKAA